MTLNEDQYKSGLELLELFDKLQANIIFAAWMLNTVNKWQFFIITPLLSQKGPLWITEKIISIYKHIGFPGDIKPLDMIISKPEDNFYQWQKVLPYDIQEKQVINNPFRGIPYITKAFFYRCTLLEKNNVYNIESIEKKDIFQIINTPDDSNFFEEQVNKIITSTKLKKIAIPNNYHYSKVLNRTVVPLVIFLGIILIIIIYQS